VSRKQIAGRVVAFLLLLTAFLYFADYIVLRICMRHATASYPFESLTRARLLAIPMKNGTTTFEIDEVNPTEVVTCVHAIFPRSGASPCWYLKPRLNRPIPIG
jgi:hypothetical protein